MLRNICGNTFANTFKDDKVAPAKRITRLNSDLLMNG